MALAYETIEAEKCPKCGVPAWHAYSEDNTIGFMHDHIDCEACKFDEQNTSSKERKHPGRTKYVKAIPEDGSELPTRQDFQKAMLAKQAKEALKEKQSGNTGSTPEPTA